MQTGQAFRMYRFRLSAFPVDDYDTTNARIEKKMMREIGLHDGDTIKITGMESSGAVCRQVEDGFEMPNDSDVTYLSPNPVVLPSIRVSNHVIRNINPHGSGLTPVSVEKMHDGTVEADRACLMSLNVNSNGAGFDKSRLNKLIACKNNRFYFRDAEPKNNFGCLITGVEPTDYAQITEDTAVEIVPADPKVIHSSFEGAALDRLVDVAPIVYQETRNGINATVPSLEVFETGIRFAVYIKSSFGRGQAVPDGSVSLTVTLEDDLGNSYALSQHGGSGSHSSDGFEYRYQFHCNPIIPNARRLTVTLHEIRIQERFPRDAGARRPWLETRLEYSKMGKMPPLFIISGPWRATFPTGRQACPDQAING